MAVVWTISGAGRGVGKSHVALALCELLPGSVYAKLGCGRNKRNKPGNLFRRTSELAAFVERSCRSHDHVVAECNAWARKGKGDVIIFIDAVPDRTDVRADADEMRARAHIQVGPQGALGDWKAVVSKHLADKEAIRAVCDLLADQKRFVGSPGLAVRSKVWFVAGEEHAFGSGLATLLDRIDQYGTLTEAAKRARISYRRAWDLIKGAERHMGRKLIIPQSGGVGGGRSSLSADGRRLLDVFRSLNREVAAYADTRFAEHFCEEETNEQV